MNMNNPLKGDPKADDHGFSNKEDIRSYVLKRCTWNQPFRIADSLFFSKRSLLYCTGKCGLIFKVLKKIGELQVSSNPTNFSITAA